MIRRCVEGDVAGTPSPTASSSSWFRTGAWQTEGSDAPAALPDASTTVPEPATTILLTIDESAPPAAPALDSGYIATVAPDGFEVEGLFTTTTEQPAGWLELWAAAGAPRDKGRWLAVQVNRVAFELRRGRR